MDLGLRDRVAIVGGSSRGIGRAIALAFAGEGANVTICARTESDLRRTEIEIARTSSQQHVLAIPADITQPRDIRRVVRDTVSRFGQINILVTHMANRVQEKPVERPSEMSDDIIISTHDESFLGAVRFAKEVVPFMKQQRWGRIVNLLPHFSINAIPVGTVTSADESALNTSNRMALTGYAKSLANELAPFNINVNNLIHGPVQSEALTEVLLERSKAEDKNPNHLMQEAASLIPMGRLGRPEEVADLVVYLCSERASYLTGASVVLDGGMRQDMR